MAKRAAKNINSLESQTMVPTATIFGRFNLGGVETALLIGMIIPEMRAIPSLQRGKKIGIAVKRITGYWLGLSEGISQ